MRRVVGVRGVQQLDTVCLLEALANGVVLKHVNPVSAVSEGRWRISPSLMPASKRDSIPRSDGAPERDKPSYRGVSKEALRKRISKDWIKPASWILSTSHATVWCWKASKVGM